MISGMEVKPPTALDACRELLGRCKRDHVPIRREFVQHSPQIGGRGPLAAFVTGRRELALDLYLLLHASACGGDFDTRLHARVWARALGLRESAHATSVISRNWGWLEGQGLVSKMRDHRLVNVTLLKEDASGTPYAHPGKSGNYFKLSHAYWLDGWRSALDLPGKTALLILLSRRPGSDLPQERAPEWYGISPDTLARGIRKLEDLKLLQTTILKKQAPLSPVGYSWEQRYRLCPPFAQPTSLEVRPRRRKRAVA
jgi:hypothetical protein